MSPLPEKTAASSSSEAIPKRKKNCLPAIVHVQGVHYLKYLSIKYIIKCKFNGANHKMVPFILQSPNDLNMTSWSTCAKGHPLRIRVEIPRLDLRKIQSFQQLGTTGISMKRWCNIPAKADQNSEKNIYIIYIYISKPQVVCW